MESTYTWTAGSYSLSIDRQGNLVVTSHAIPRSALLAGPVTCTQSSTCPALQTPQRSSTCPPLQTPQRPALFTQQFEQVYVSVRPWNWKAFNMDQAVVLPRDELYAKLRAYWDKLRAKLLYCMQIQSYEQWQEIQIEVTKIRQLFERMTTLSSEELYLWLNTHASILYQITSDELLKKFRDNSQ